MTDFRLGVNYWPARTAMHWWSRFDRAEVERDFGIIRDLGLSEVRIFLMWEAFQPLPHRISRSAVEQLLAVLDAGQARHLRVTLSLFCGHMSGANWLPPWVLERAVSPARFRVVSSGRIVEGVRARNIYSDAELVARQLDLARCLVAEVGGHRALGGWDLGNEFSNLRVPDSPADAASWSARLSEVLARTGAEVTGGLHGEDLEGDRRIRPSSIARSWDVVAMHGYPLYSPDADGPDDPDWLPFLCRLAGRFALRPVVAQEFGLPDHELGERRVAEYAAAVLERLWTAGVTGAMWWCYADYAGRLAGEPPFDRAPHELHFGLVRSDGSPKPVADVMRSFAGRTVQGVPADGAEPDSEEAFYAGLPDSLGRAYAVSRAPRGRQDRR